MFHGNYNCVPKTRQVQLAVTWPKLNVSSKFFRC